MIRTILFSVRYNSLRNRSIVCLWCYSIDGRIHSCLGVGIGHVKSCCWPAGIPFLQPVRIHTHSTQNSFCDRLTIPVSGRKAVALGRPRIGPAQFLRCSVISMARKLLASPMYSRVQQKFPALELKGYRANRRVRCRLASCNRVATRKTLP